MVLAKLNKQKLLAATLSFVLLFIFILPIFVQAADPLVTCNGTEQDKCDFDALIEMINGIIKWIISIAGVIFAISFIYGGFLWMKSGDNPGDKSKAKDVLWSTLKGFILILVAWVIIYTILDVLVNDESKPSVLKFLGELN